MKYLKKNRRPSLLSGASQEDPMLGVANLFDVALVFIVALFLSLMATYKMQDFFDPESEVTIMKKVKDQWQIITKKGKEVKVKKMTDRKVGGDEGIRLGTAYRLKDGRMIYIPNEAGEGVLNEIE
ncbi:MAG: DUF2149 domain-containing protein [Desulfobulbaceae bacterium]|jgi:hypothetical protein|nr:DUF2149 domain-containing protein [Desulfobulbaceae bacterium]